MVGSPAFPPVSPFFAVCGGSVSVGDSLCMLAGPMLHVGEAIFRRVYSEVVVQLDCRTLKASFIFHHDSQTILSVA